MTRTELAERIRNGENSGIEFKRDDARPESLAKEMAALLNLEGGHILLGVEDDRTVTGLTRDSKKAEEWVMETARTHLRPAAIPFWETFDWRGGLIVGVISLPADAPDKPYKAKRGSAWVTQVRVGTTSRDATDEEEARLYMQSGRLPYDRKPIPGATIDDLVLSTPWGAASSWSQQSLTSIFQNEVTGGDRFFEILEQMQQDLGHNGEVVELMYLCTSLGFEGRYRVMPRGTAALAELRDGVYRLIRTRRGDFERELSPHWRGTDLGHRTLRQRIPFWAIGAGTALMAALIYLGFNFMLAGRSDIAFAQMYGLPPHGTPVIPRVEMTAPPPPPPVAAAPSNLSAKLHEFLAQEIKSGLVVVLEDAQSVTVRLTGNTMFASGTATLNSSYNPLLARIGAALEDEKGGISVVGYTDNQPIHTARFPSNFELSLARAQAVAEMVETKLSNPKRVKAIGRADADPLASNATAEGRQKNRRTEIVLTRTSETP